MNLDISYIITIIFLTLNILTFILGYFIGKISKINIVYDTKNTGDIAQKDIQKNIIQKIEIDEKKIVSKIDTNSLEKKYDNLGNTIVSDTNISNSISKLKKLKE
jgi:S-adenosylmethionine synthetase